MSGLKEYYIDKNTFFFDLPAPGVDLENSTRDEDYPTELDTCKFMV